MSFLYVNLGPKGNLFGRGTVTVSPAEASVAPKAGLYDSDPSTPHIAGSIAADSYMRVQTNLVTNGGFETSTLSGWTSENSGAGVAPAEETGGGNYRSGSKSVYLSTGFGASPVSRVYQDITANAGESIKVSAWVKTSSTNHAGAVYLLNLKTGKYYNGSTNAWTASPAAIGSSTATSFTEITETLTVEDFDTCRADTVTLRLSLELIASGVFSGGVYFDDVLVVPGVNFASIHGHNYGPVSPLVQSSDDASSWTTRGTMTIQRPAFYKVLDATYYHEYWQIKLSGTNHDAPYTGEAVLGQYTTCATSPMWGIPKTRNTPGVRTRGPSGRPHVYSYATDPPQDIALTFSARTAAAAKELADGLWLRSGQGLYPVVLVPIDTETDVYFGRFMDPVTVERPFQGIYETTLSLVGDPFPTVGA